ncbi:large ribosomal subunit protein uL1-like [Saccopteryx leptura]|uniref:large ribosomal subunit protein uL1-like n=1 Tax=Saccopteryx leptura TaxID=249018 RepID=UPI00339C9629
MTLAQFLRHQQPRAAQCPATPCKRRSEREVLPGNQSTLRKFSETVTLQTSLQNCDPQEDKHFSGTVRLRSIPRPKFSVCALGDQQHCDEAKAVDIPHMYVQMLERLKNKNLVKKLAEERDAFLASESLSEQTPRILGPGLNKAGRCPSLLTHSENMVARVNEVKPRIQFRRKKAPPLKVTGDELVYRIDLAVNLMVSSLKNNWVSYIKSSLGKPQRLH